MKTLTVLMFLLLLISKPTPGLTEPNHLTGLKAEIIQPYSGDLPLKLIPASQKNKLPMVFMISGDGGWSRFDQSLAEELASKGLSVLGLDAQKYFWKAKTPDQASKEISLALSYYLGALGKESLVLGGYSFGASIIPFVANRLPANLKTYLKAVISLSPDVTADFEIHLVDLLNFSSKYKYNVIAEMKKLAPLSPVSIFGADEGDKIKTSFLNAGLKVITIAGDHHFDKEYEKIATVFVKQIPN